MTFPCTAMKIVVNIRDWCSEKQKILKEFEISVTEKKLGICLNNYLKTW
jgi:hypothetical protein